MLRNTGNPPFPLRFVFVFCLYSRTVSTGTMVHGTGEVQPKDKTEEGRKAQGRKLVWEKAARRPKTPASASTSGRTSLAEGPRPRRIARSTTRLEQPPEIH